MAISPITDEEFLKIANEEGASSLFPFASVLRMIESSGGTNQSAFIDPRLKAGQPIPGNKEGRKFDSRPEKIGYGSMQLTKGTFEDVMPGVDFYSADDATLTRAGFRLLKKAQNADGTIDIQRGKNIYFGTGTDTSHGYSPSTDPKVDAKIRAGVAAVEALKDGKDVTSSLNAVIKTAFDRSTAADPASVKQSTMPGTPAAALLASNQVKAQTAEAESLLKFDPVAAQQKYDEAAKTKADYLQSVLDNQLAGQRRILDKAGMNPYGVFAEAEATFEALRGANSRLRETVADMNYQTKPANDGVLGFLETFARRVAADQNYGKDVKNVNDLQKAASDYQTVITQMQTNASAGTQTLAQAISIDTSARQAGSDALLIDRRVLEVEQKNAGIQQRNAALQLQAERISAQRQIEEVREAGRNQRAQDRLVVEEAKLEARAAESDRDYQLARDKFERSKKDKDDINAWRKIGAEQANRRIDITQKRMESLEKRDRTQENLNQIRQMSEVMRMMKTASAMIGKFGTEDIDTISRVASQLTGTQRSWTPEELEANFPEGSEAHTRMLATLFPSDGMKTLLRNKDVAANLQQLRISGSPSEQEAAKRLQPALAQTEAEIMRARGITTKSLDALEEKEKASRVAKVAELTRETLANAPTSELAFDKNPINIRPMKDWIEVAGGQGGLVTTLKTAGIRPSEISGDAAMVVKLFEAQQAGRTGISAPELLKQLESYYKNLAKMRAAEDVIYKANIPVNGERYLVQTARDKKDYDLATADGLNRYSEHIKRGINWSSKLSGGRGSSLQQVREAEQRRAQDSF